MNPKKQSHSYAPTESNSNFILKTNPELLSKYLVWNLQYSDGALIWNCNPKEIEAYELESLWFEIVLEKTFSGHGAIVSPFLIPRLTEVRKWHAMKKQPHHGKYVAELLPLNEVSLDHCDKIKTAAKAVEILNITLKV